MTVVIIHNLNNFLCNFMTFKVATLMILQFLLFCIPHISQKLKQKKRKSKRKNKKDANKDQHFGNEDNVSGPAAPAPFDGSNLQLPLPTWQNAAE